MRHQHNTRECAQPAYVIVRRNSAEPVAIHPTEQKASAHVRRLINVGDLGPYEIGRCVLPAGGALL